MIPQLCAPPPLAHNPRGLLNPHAYKKATYIKCNILPDIAEEMTSTEYNMKLCSRLWYYWMFTVYLPTSKSYLGIQLAWSSPILHKHSVCTCKQRRAKWSQCRFTFSHEGIQSHVMFAHMDTHRCRRRLKQPLTTTEANVEFSNIICSDDWWEASGGLCSFSDSCWLARAQTSIQNMLSANVCTCILRTSSNSEALQKIQ